jgi:parallel beta-helix repeat protein
MKNRLFNKNMVLGLIILFIGANILPQISADNFGTSSLSATFYVDDDSPCPGDGTLLSPYCMIQYAIDNASGGDSIEVANGTYYENIIIDKSLILSWYGLDINGTDTGNPIIEGSGTGNVVTILSSNVAIGEFIIQNSGNDVYNDAGIYINNSNSIQIKNNIITNNQANGIKIVGSGVDDDITIKENQIVNNDGDGIALKSSNGNEILFNCINNNGRDGIFLYTSSNNDIGTLEGMGNNISENKQSGIDMYGVCIENRIYKNLIYKNKEGGIFMDTRPSRNKINQNTISNNSEYGIYLILGCINNLIRKNNFINNQPKHAKFVNSFFNQWQSNYWDDYKGSGAYWIWGTIIIFPWPNFDPTPETNPHPHPIVPDCSP